MFQAKDGFLDRVEQSFLIFKQNALLLVLPMLIFNFVFLVVIPLVFGITFNAFFPLSELMSQWENAALSFSTSIAITYALALGGLVVLAYLFIFIPVQIGTLKAIKQSLSWEILTPKENILQYGIQNIGSAFRTYWYIFAYVALIPALVFISGGFLFIFWEIYLHQEVLRNISFGIMGISIILFIVFSISRGIRSSFSLMNAVDKQSYTKENFKESLALTDGKWWQIFWNIIVVSWIGGLVIGLLWNLAGSIGFLGTDFSLLSNLPKDGSQDYLHTLNQFSHFNIFSFIGSTLKTSFSSVLGVYLSVFLYVMMYMLESKRVFVPRVEENISQQEL